MLYSCSAVTCHPLRDHGAGEGAADDVPVAGGHPAG
jgi:hypothetical protein